MPKLNRRDLLGTAALSAASLIKPQPADISQLNSPISKRMMHRTLYFNDARHFYFYSFDPPMMLKDAWRPIDEVVGTSINTFVYGVESGGLFNDTKVGLRWGADQRPFTSLATWRTWYNMQSLIERGLDPLQVLIDRAHYWGMEFIISMRIGGTPSKSIHRIGVAGATVGGGSPRENYADFSHFEVRQQRFAWLEELAGYPVEGIELDFAFTPFYFKPDEIRAKTSLMTEYVRSISKMIRSKGKEHIVGARVFPTEQMNLALGLDVHTWLSEKLVNYVSPLFYSYHLLDPHLPFESLVETAHAYGGQVYPVLQPYYLKQEDYGSYFARPAMIRAAAANYWAKGADGLMAWFLHWPLGDTERSILTDIGDPEIVKEKNKQYVFPPRNEEAAVLGYGQPLPLQLPKADPGFTGEIPFYVAEDLNTDRVERVRLRLKILNLATADRLKVKLNGSDLSGELLRRTKHRYELQWLEYTLRGLRPRRGHNLLTVALEERPEGLKGGITIDLVELLVEYDHPYAVDAGPEFL